MSSGVVYVDQQAGATPDAQFAAAFALLPNGGIADCEGWGATFQLLAKTVTIPPNVLVRCNPATKFQPATPTMDMFVLSPDAKLEKITVNTGNQPAYSGKTITIAPGSEDVNHTWLHDAHIVSFYAYPNVPPDLPTTSVKGIGLYCEATGAPGKNMSFVSVSNLRIQGFGDGIYLKASGTNASSGAGYINGNQFTDIHISYSCRGLHLEASNGAQINGNGFINFDYESGGPGTVAVFAEGDATSSVSQNTILGRVWDTDVSLVFGKKARFNMFIGDTDGIPTDFPTINNYIMVEGGHFPYTVVVFFVGLWRWITGKL